MIHMLLTQAVKGWVVHQDYLQVLTLPMWCLGGIPREVRVHTSISIAYWYLTGGSSSAICAPFKRWYSWDHGFEVALMGPYHPSYLILLVPLGCGVYGEGPFTVVILFGLWVGTIS